MRTRTSGPVSPPSTPPRQLHAPRTRKRRSRSGSTGREQAAPASTQDVNGQETSPPTDTELQSRNTTRFLTPRKAKRVRFSEPTQGLHSEGLLSTGLTPGFRRTRIDFDDHDRLIQPRSPESKSVRRATLPARLDDNFSSSPVVQHIQYAPLRQVIDARMRRRLRRSHLSEEMNQIDYERREDQYRKKEITQLRTKRDQSEAKIKDLMFEIEAERQRGIQIGTEEERHAEALHEELERLRQDLATRDEEEEQRRRIEGSPTEFDEDENLWDDQVPLSSPLAADFDTSSSSPVIPISRGPLPPSSPPGAESVATTFNTELCYDSHDLIEQLANAKREASEARAALQVLHDDLLGLGLDDDSLTSEQLTRKVKTAFRKARLDVETLLPGETPGGFENVKVLPMMLEHIKSLIGMARGYQTDAATAEQSSSAMRIQFNAALEKIAHLENERTVLFGQRQNAFAEIERKDREVRDMKQSAEKRASLITERDHAIESLEQQVAAAKEDIEAKNEYIKTLESQTRNDGISIDRLNNALTSYRREVEDLENVVNHLQNDLNIVSAQASSLRSHVHVQQGKINQLKQTLNDVATRVESHLKQSQTSSAHRLDDQTQSANAMQDFMEQKLEEANQ